MPAAKKALTGYEKDDSEALWLWDDMPELEMEIGYKVESLLHFASSPYQEISIVETKAFGRMLVLDGTPQITEKDGFIYNEMITHIALATHQQPERIAIIGGGDCGPAREALKYCDVRQIDVVEIDPQVIEACRTWLTGTKPDDRISIVYNDGYPWMRKRKKRSYDVILVDRSDPYGPATSLYKQRFYEYVYEALDDDGIAVFQSGSPFYDPNTVRSTFRHLNKLFPVVRPYLCVIPMFPGGVWCFMLASKQWDPLQANLERLQWRETKYVNPDVFRSSFVLPNYVQRIVSMK
ncbi:MULTISPECIES: polyamine aminopropyltransferase [unclassified Paenibacillus]|uniref:polyamine aminopropyltransferase n=1 Tax=unclassified Paenibacillus TaxID=185978 RepID=UPI001C121A58|nr:MULTISPECIES: polyamine aminopropyltransferase [unclassified Paenibacillus]MBU5443203.1 polyamine aminopropyltransferase [Paenibacillus sp. MSJ-34]CAH0121397.1 Polyamine aminopropyltransferase [Paenibacillus sp. CECT 9249]